MVTLSLLLYLRSCGSHWREGKVVLVRTACSAEEACGVKAEEHEKVGSSGG